LLTPQLSIIIPTYNRKEVLLKALEGYKHQTSREEILEVIVVDDGSTDGTGPAVGAFSRTSPIMIRYLSQQNKGPAAARNYGIREAKGTLLLFADDDIIPQSALVAEHTAWHGRHPGDNFAILGLVSWSPDVHPTPFMEWLGLDGVIFGYRFLMPGKEVSFEYFYSCNLSVKREFLMKNGMFDENFRAAAYEDTELGYRLINKGLCVLYNPEAMAHHYRRFSYADACRRQELVCKANVLFETTEAGRYMKDRAPRAKPITLKHRVKRAMARVITPFLVLLTPLLDTHLRLPRRVYCLLYSHHIAPKAQARFEHRRPRHEDAKGT
jgi:glycosyltransferase involved in cell wall biosynthesis